MDFLRKHKTKLQAAAILAGSLLVFWLLWLTQVQSYRQNRMTLYLSDTREVATLPDAGTYTQTFRSDSAFSTLGLAPAPEDEEDGVLSLPEGELPTLSVYDGAGSLLGTATATRDALQDKDAPLDGYYLFDFGRSMESPDGEYLLELTPNGASFAKSEFTQGDWVLRRDGKRQAGTLCFAVTTAPIGGFVDGFYWVFAVLCGAALAGLFVASRADMPLHRLFAVAAGTLGLLYCFALPPYSSPDEQFHINQTFNISSAMLGQGPWQVPWGSNYKRASDTDTLVEDYNTTAFSYQRLGRDFFTTAPDGETVKMQGEEVGGYRLIYWPAALAVSACRLLGLGFVPTLYVGRLVNLALYLLLCTLAVKLAPFGKSIFAAVPLLPMSLHLAASFSRDCLTIGLYLFYTALCMHYTFTKETVGLKDILLLLGVSFLAAPAKAVYAPLLLLCLAIPPGKLRLKGKTPGKRPAYALLGLVVCVGALSFALQGGGAIVQEAATEAPTPVVVRRSSSSSGSRSSSGGRGSGGGGTTTQQPALTALEMAEAGYNPDAIRYSLHDFFSRPFTIVQLCLRTLAENTTFYLQTMLGGSLGYFSLPISWVFVIALAVWLCASVIPPPGQLRPKPGWQLFAGFLAVCGVGLVFVGCIMWTPTYYDTIYGVQGRYFLPILPLALCALSPIIKKVAATRDIARPLVYAGAALSLGVLANAVLVVLAR